MKKLKWKYTKANNLREINVNGVNFVFVYAYCLSDANLMSMVVPENSIIVNLHRWNGSLCISQKAYERAEQMKIKLMTTEEFHSYLNVI